MKISRFISYLSIVLFIIPLFPIFNCAESYEDNNVIPEIDSIMYVNLTVLNESQAKVVMTHYYSFNKTYLKNLSNDINPLNKTINLGVKISLNNGGFIGKDEAIAETSLGEMKIIFFNESVLDTEQINCSLFENETIFYKITYYITGFAWGVPSINFIRIPLNFNLNNKNICNQQLSLKIILPYKSKINENDEKYISFFGYPLNDVEQINENFIDKMLSGEPLIVLFSKNQVGTELSLFSHIDYYTSDVPKITLKYNHEFDINNYRIIENLKIKNRNDFPLYLLNSYTSEGYPYYTIINSSEKNNYDDVYELSPTNGSLQSLYNYNKIPLDYELIDCSYFGWGKRSFPLESYEISHTIPYKINFNSDSLISYLVDYDLEIKKDNIFEINQESSYYSIVPTIIYTPPIFDENRELIKDSSYYGITEFETKLNDDINGLRILLDLVPKEFNKDCNFSVYRLYSTWCNAESKKIQNQVNNYYLFEQSDFEVDNLQNEITIYYNFKLNTRTDVILQYLFWILINPFLVLGYLIWLVPRTKKLMLKIIIIVLAIGTSTGLLIQRPSGYPFPTIFDISIIIGTIIGLSIFIIWKKKSKKLICPKCGKKAYLRYRKTKSYKWKCIKCNYEFNEKNKK